MKIRTNVDFHLAIEGNSPVYITYYNLISKNDLHLFEKISKV
jgi:hypothetical protein